MQDRLAAALRWITRELEALGVPFQVVGGTAARAWGARRPVADIDLYVPASALDEVLARLGDRIKRPAERHRDDHWDVTFAKLDYHGQPIEIAVAESARFRDASDGTWYPAAIDFDRSVRRNVMGVTIPVMPRAQLIDYKRRLGRDVDARDIAEIEAEPDTVAAFYDGLADDYHLVYRDWKTSIKRQATALDGLITAELGSGPRRILDCTCGVGTQALGLAALGHSVVGADVSAGAIARARSESERRGLDIPFLVADIRSLASTVEEQFDVVLSADNALPHLLSEADLRLGVRNMVALIRPGGLFVASIRDYDAMLADPPLATMPVVSGEPGARRVTFQLRDWKTDGRTYDIEMFILREEGERNWDVRVHRSCYRAVMRADLRRIVAEEGIANAAWGLPDTTGFFQPVITGTRPVPETNE